MTPDTLRGKLREIVSRAMTSAASVMKPEEVENQAITAILEAVREELPEPRDSDVMKEIALGVSTNHGAVGYNQCLADIRGKLQ